MTHLHSDHIADLATFYVDAMFGRTEPWEIWGPSSEKPELGLNASIAGLRQVRPALISVALCAAVVSIAGLPACL